MIWPYWLTWPIWLRVHLATPINLQQLKRLSRDRSRPLLQTADRRARLEALAEHRNPLYEEVAQIVFPAQNRGLDAVAKDLERKIRHYGNPE